MNNQKPVWRMNTGNGVPSDLGDEALFTDISTCKTEVSMIEGYISYIRRHNEVWDIYEIAPITAYQTTRTKKTKYEQVECFKCNDSRFKGLVFCGGYFEYRKCPNCNGKGYRLERIK